MASLCAKSDKPSISALTHKWPLCAKPHTSELSALTHGQQKVEKVRINHANKPMHPEGAPELLTALPLIKHILPAFKPVENLFVGAEACLQFAERTAAPWFSR
jgi:hypothetical protein